MNDQEYTDILTALHSCFQTVTTPQPIPAARLLMYEPSSVSQTPLMYSILDAADMERHGQLDKWRYRTLHRLVLSMQDQEQSEKLLRQYVRSIPRSIKMYRTLGTSGGRDAIIDEIDAGWVEIDSVEFRRVDFYSTVLES